MSAQAPGNAWDGFVTWWNSAGLAWKFSVSFGALIVLVIIAAIIKLTYDKCILKSHVKKEKKLREEQAANDRAEQIAIKRLSSMEEGELFGVRAIQSGFYGGVAQSAPSSPVGSRAPSLYNQPVSPSGPLNNSSPYLPLMHPAATAASPMASTTSLPQTRSPLGLNPSKDGQPIPRGPPSPVPNAMLRDTQRPGTAASNRGFDQPRPPLLHERQDSAQSSRTINLDGLAPNKSQPATTPLRPSTSDASNGSSTHQGTSHGSRGSSFTSTYSFEDAEERQPQIPNITKPFEGLPTLPVLQPLTADVQNGDPRRPSPAPAQSGLTAELPADLQKSPPRETNFSAPFRRPSQPENMVRPLSPGFGPLPAGAMNAGPQQFGQNRTQSPGPRRTDSPGPMNGPPRRTDSPGPMNGPRRTDSPGPFRGPNPNMNQRSMSPGPRGPPPRQGSGPGPRGPDPNRPRNGSMGPRRGAPAPLNFAPPEGKQPSLPPFLNGPKTAPLNKTNSSHLMPERPKQNRLTADILNDFYDQYTYDRNSKDDSSLNHGPGQHFEMQRINEPISLPGSPRQQQYRHPADRRLA